MISAGKYKTELNPFEPLSDEARAALQARVDAVYALFVGDVAKGRGVSASDVRSGFGEGRLVDAKAALKMGMVSKIATLDDVLARFGAVAPSPRGAMAADESPDAQASASQPDDHAGELDLRDRRLRLATR